MNPLPHIPGVGDLRVAELYEYFDGPLLFSAKGDRGDLFLVVFIRDDTSGRSWLCAPMSSQRDQQVQAGRIDLRDVFAHAEGGKVIRVDVSRSGALVAARWVACASLVDDELPLAGMRT